MIYIPIVSLLFVLAAVFIQAHQQDVLVIENEPCVNWEATAAAFQDAFAQWKEPPCYTFTYTFLGFSIHRQTVMRTVQNGTSLQQGDGRQLQTLMDFWNLIQEKCIQNCPTSGAHSCQMEYTTSEDNGLVYPSYLFIDKDARMMDEELIYRIEDVRIISDCAELEPEVIQKETIKPELCVNYETVKTNLETALVEWESAGDCYNYTIERIGRVPEEFRGPFEIVVRDGVSIIVSAAAQSDMDRTLSHWLDEIQEMCVDRCRVEHDQEPYYDCSIEFDATWGYPTYIMFDPDQRIADEESYYRVSNFSRCEGRKPGVCIDYDLVKPNFDAAMEKWNLVDGCYNYTIERLGRISEEFRGPFQVQVRDGVPQVINMPANGGNNVDGPNMNFTLSDWMAQIEEHCIMGCEVASSSMAYYYCSLEYDPTWGYPTSIFFDPDEAIADEELYYALSNFIPCRTIPDTGDPETSNCTSLSDDAYEFDAAYAKLETLLTENPCYDFTYTLTAFVYPPPQSVTVSVRDENSANQQSTGEFSSLLELLIFYKTTCFPCLETERPFSCSISYNNIGIPTSVSIDYIEMVADDETGYVISNVTFVSCSTEPYQGECDPGWREAKAKWPSPVCYDYSVRRVGEILAEWEGPFTVQVRDNEVINGNATSVNMTFDDMFALIEEKCVAGCPDTDAFQCANTYDADFGFPTVVNIDYDEFMVDEEEIYIISDFKSVACSSDSMAVCKDWEQLRDTIDEMQDSWEDPPCYQYTIQANSEAAITVNVRDKNVVLPSGISEGSFEPLTMDDLMTEIRGTCIGGCPSNGSANCSYETTVEGSSAKWVVETKESTNVFTVSNFEVVSCDKAIVSEQDAASCAITTSMPIGLVALAIFHF